MLQKLFSRRLWNRDFLLLLLACTIATYPNSIFTSLLPVYVLDLGGATVLSGRRFSGGVSENEMADWVNGLNLGITASGN